MSTYDLNDQQINALLTLHVIRMTRLYLIGSTQKHAVLNITASLIIISLPQTNYCINLSHGSRDVFLWQFQTKLHLVHSRAIRYVFQQSGVYKSYMGSEL